MKQRSLIAAILACLVLTLGAAVGANRFYQQGMKKVAAGD